MDKIREAAQDYRSYIVSIMEGEKSGMLLHHNSADAYPPQLPFYYWL
jgi:hypothetical protein